MIYGIPPMFLVGIIFLGTLLYLGYKDKQRIRNSDEGLINLDVQRIYKERALWGLR